MAIYQDIQITVNQGIAQPDKSLYIFRGDGNIILNFKLVTPQYMLTKDMKDNLVTRFGVDNFELRLQLEKGYDKIIRGVITTDGYCRTQLTQNVIQELRVGSYSYQITLIDDDANAIMTFPICKAKLNILDRMSLTAEELAVPGGLSGEAMADLSVIVDNGEVLEAFDSNGNYIKTDWNKGDIIYANLLDKIEDAIDKINQNEKNDVASLNKKVDSNYNVLTTQMNNLVLESGGDSNLEVVQARSTFNTLNDRLNDINAKIDTIDESLGDITESTIKNIENVLEETSNIVGNIEGRITNTLYPILDLTVTPDVEWQPGYYRINNQNQKQDLSTAAGKSVISYPIKVRKGDIIEISTNDYTASSVIALTDDNESYYQSVVKGTDTLAEFKYRVSNDCYVIFGSRNSYKDEFSCSITPSESSILEYHDTAINTLRVTEYNSVTKAGVLNSIQSSNSLSSFSLEFVFSTSSTDALKWIYGYGSTNLLAIYYTGSEVYTSLNVGGYETSTSVKYDLNSLCHVVITYDASTKTKKAYINSVNVGEKSNESMAMQVFNDNVSSDYITVYQKRLWGRVLDDNEIKILYNFGYPTKAIISNNIKQGMISELVSSGISTDGWKDNISDTIISLPDDVVLNTIDINNLYSDVMNIKINLEKDNGIFRDVIYPDYRVEWSNRACHDCTFIDDKLVSFSKPSDGNAMILSLNNSKYDLVSDKSIRINFVEENTRELEMKSTDYKYDKLLVGNGRAIKYEETSYLEQGAKLYVFYNAIDWLTAASEVNFTNCGDYDIIDISDLGYKVYGFWGNVDDTIFVSCNLFNDIYKIKLGKGTTQYNNGMYSFISDTRYNGTYEILDHWHSEYSLDPDSAHGGQLYKGCLYIAPNRIDDCKVYKYHLMNNGKIALDILNFESIDANGKPEYHYIDGLCIKDDVMYIQPLCANGSYSTISNVFLIADI